jgi:hypothetical protein
MANITTNRDIDYILKDFNSTVDAIIAFANVNYGPGTSANRLWTDFNADSFSRTWLEIVSYIADSLFFYFDNQATESYLQTASTRSAIELIAKQFGYVPATATSSSGVATFTVTGPVTIPRGFKVQSSDGQPFFVTTAVTAIAAGDINASVLQGEIVTEQFVAEGLQSEEFDLRGPNVIRDLTNLIPGDITPQLTVSGNSYTLVDSFLKNNGTDMPAVFDSLGVVIGGGGRVFSVGTRPDDTPYVSFGDGIFGRKLQPGEVISITYRTGGGSAGNIAKQSLTTLVSSLPAVTAVTNNSEFSGGADQQSIDQLRELIPASLRTLERAVSEQDYSDILIANFSQVFTASTEINNTDPGVDLNIYVVPQGSGIPQISDNPILKNRLSSFIDRRKTVTVQFQIRDAFGIDTLIGLEVFISDTASKSTVKSSLIKAITNFFSLSTGGAKGSGIKFSEQILLKDINNIIETISGIERFEIKRLSYRPRVEQRVKGFLTRYKTSDVTIFPNISETEWLLAASSVQTRTGGILLFDNTSLVGFTYNSGTGVVTYSFPVNLTSVAPGDQFRDGTGTDFSILSVNTTNNTIAISSGLTINNTVTTSAHGSIRSGNTTYESFKCFKKIKAKATNLAVDSITDTNLDLSVDKGTSVALSSRILLDNSKVFIPGQYATGQYYLVDASTNIWEIVHNDSNTIKVSVSAVSDAGITTVVPGEYKIVRKMSGKQITFRDTVFSIQFNSDNTVYSIGGEFSQIGTIGDDFTISSLQSSIGNLGVAVDISSYDVGTGTARLNAAPNLSGVNSEYVLIDSSGQILNIVGVDNEAKPSVFYDQVNFSSTFQLNGSGLGSQVAQGFKVPTTDLYAVVTFYLKREGNILGNLTAKIVNDLGGLPNLSSVVATSNATSVTNVTYSGYNKISFGFNTPPTLSAGTQYHLVLVPDAAYVSSEQTGIAFTNTGLVGFTYSSINGTVSYLSPVSLGSVVPGNYFRDANASPTYYLITAVDDLNNTLVIQDPVTGTFPVAITATPTPSSSNYGSVEIRDRILVGIDNSSPTYTNGSFSRYDGVSSWSNHTTGPNQFVGGGVDYTGSNGIDAIFSVEGTKSVILQSNLTPVLGSGATISTRYYDDQNEMSVILGITNGSPTSASNVTALGKGTVASIPNKQVDTFTFRSSRYADDIVNIRLNEIPQIKESDIDIKIYGGVD